VEIIRREPPPRVVIVPAPGPVYYRAGSIPPGGYWR
jgi:hypothetical protein